MKISTTKNKFFLAIVLVLITWSLAVFLFQYIRNKQEQTLTLMTEVALQSSKKEEVKKLSNQLNVLGPKIGKTEEFFLNSGQGNLVSFIEAIEAMSGAAGIELVISSIEVMKMKEGVLSEDFENLNLKLKIKGEWAGIFHFLNIIESLPYHITYNEVKLDKTKGTPEESDLFWDGLMDFSVTKKAG